MIFLAVHVKVNGFARQTVRLIANGTVERIDIILIQTPPLTVWSFAVKAVSGLAFCRSETAVQEPVEIFLGEKLEKKFGRS